jgi:hypothetical protein
MIETNAPALVQLTAGNIAYRDGEGREIGRERFEFARLAGGRTLRALCEMNDVGVLRDVSLSMNLDWTPRDAFCRVSHNGVTSGTTWFAVEPDAVVCEGLIAGMGRISQRMPMSTPLGYLGLHPVVCDALIVVQRGKDEPGVFRPIACLTNSRAPNGDVGLYLTPVVIDLAYIGEEDIEVTAGRFRADHYQLRWSPEWPPADVWVHGEDCLFVKMTWSLIETWYELVSLEPQA